MVKSAFFKAILIFCTANKIFGYLKFLSSLGICYCISQPQEAGAGFPGLEGFGAMSNFLNNPMFMNMAKQVKEINIHSTLVNPYVGLSG